jgi:hypothetical protein
VWEIINWLAVFGGVITAIVTPNSFWWNVLSGVMVGTAMISQRRLGMASQKNEDTQE